MQVFQPVQQPKAERAFDALVRIVWGVRDKALRRRLWHALFRDRSQQGANFRFQLSELVNRSDSVSEMGRIAYGILSPHEVVHWLERCVSSGRLKRSEANLATDFILQKTDRYGRWKAS